MVKRYKHPFGFIAMLVLLVPLLAACGGSTPETPAAAPTAASEPAAVAPTSAPAEPAEPAPAPAEPTTGGATVVLPYLRDGITSFDHAFWSSQLLVSQGTIFEGLYGYTPDLKVVPKVAESATSEQDGLIWTIKLRKDKKWSNGDPVTAKDYYVAWMRLLSPQLKDAPMWAGPWGQIKNGWSFKNGAVSPDEVGIKLIDDYTIQVTLTEPNAAFTNLLAISTSMPINAASLEANPDEWWNPDKGAVFNGPYVVQSWVSGGDVTLVRNPHYVGDGIGNVGTIILKPYPDANARMQAFENGEIHFTFLEDPSQLEYARNNPDMQGNIKEDIQNLIWQGIQYNRAIDAGPLSDIRVRQAFAMAIDKEAITESVLKGLAVPTNAFTGDPAVTEKITPLPYDVARAQQLLAEAGYPGGAGFPELTFYAPPANDPRMPMIEAVVKMWQDNLSVPIVIQNTELPIYNSLQWANFNKDIPPGYATLGGPMNWFQPIDLLLNSGHIWWFMDYKPGGVAEFVAYQDQIDAARNITEVGGWAELEARADAVWEKRQQIIAQENNEWGETMKLEPTFREQIDLIAKAFNEATDEADKLTNYLNALDLILREEQSVAQYNNYTEQNKEAQRLMIKLRQSSMEDALQYVIPLQQLAVDSAWMIPLYNDKTFYVTDPRLSGIVLNKLSWGHIFQFQYLQWNE
jgi:ABC-type transport system substrate-binding protein